jgi:uncharacterized protein (DUF1800 family)
VVESLRHAQNTMNGGSTRSKSPIRRGLPLSPSSRRSFLLAAGVSTTVVLATAAEPGLAADTATSAADGERPAMRSPLRPGSVAASAVLDTPPVAAIALNRMGFGPRAGDLAAFNSLGNADSDRLTAYVDQQLSPEAIDDADCDARLAAEGLTSLNKSLKTLWADYFVGDAGHYAPVEEVERATLIRAIYSKRQLVEVLADYWHNHFNVYAWDYWIGPTFVHYDRDVIRKHLLGNFRTMLGAVAKSPAMIFYLDNQSNFGDRPNENFGRELFELHVMGAENYLGVRDPTDPDLYDADGERMGYVDADVYGATTCFTGWRVDTDTGEYYFDESKHFPYQKVVLGKIIPEFGGIQDGETVLDMLANHPGTARYVSRRLCRRLVTDDPPDRLVEEVAGVFHEKRNAPDQLKQVVRTILLSPEFSTTWGEKIKRPNEYIFGIARTSGLEAAANADLVRNYRNAGQSLFRWSPPNGYPDDREAWSSTMPMLQRWRRCSWMLDWLRGGEGDDKDVYRFRPEEQMPTSTRTPNDIVNYWVSRILGAAMPESERQPIVDFMAYGRNPDYDLPDDQIADRLRYMIALIYMSPSCQWR